jgi:hypothetical protein
MAVMIICGPAVIPTDAVPAAALSIQLAARPDREEADATAPELDCHEEGPRW